MKYIQCLYETTEQMVVFEPTTMGKWILDQVGFEFNDIRK